MKYAWKGAKGILGTGIGFGASTLFVCTMDDIIYAKFRQAVVIPF
jgi:hypothetical protein